MLQTFEKKHWLSTKKVNKLSLFEDGSKLKLMEKYPLRTPMKVESCK